MSKALATWESCAVVPSLGNLEAYISAAMRMPMLSLDEERSFARQWRDEQNTDAASKLVLSHLKLVVSTARQYLGYGLPHADLIQEGNVGLMKAVKRFDPDKGVRLVSYAMHWIKAEIHEYILKNFRMVKMATTKAHRKLFFNLRSMKHGFKNEAAEELDGITNRDSLNLKEIESIARTLDVKPGDVIEMEARFAGGDVMLDPGPSDDGDETYGPISYLSDSSMEPSSQLIIQDREELSGEGIHEALEFLDERSRRIIEARWLEVDDRGFGKTLHDLATEFGVSAERIRQIEVAAMKRLKTKLQAAYS